jgi:hypothetical protein
VIPKQHWVLSLQPVAFLKQMSTQPAKAVSVLDWKGGCGTPVALGNPDVPTAGRELI